MRGVFHIHTLYCDGKNTCEELVLKAIDEGFSAIGFSGHSYTSFDESYCMSRQNTVRYVEDIGVLKHKYCGKINIYCGIEQEYYAEPQCFKPDYVIGSVHYVKKDGVYIPIDESRADLLAAVENHYSGDIYALAEDYYLNVGNVATKTSCDVIGHFDLISKFNEAEVMFDEREPRYVEAWHCAADKLLATGKIFEVNTGAISRGYRTLPYPSEDMLCYIAKRGGRVTVTADCHDANMLKCGFDTAFALIKEVGAEYIDLEDVLLSKAALVI